MKYTHKAAAKQYSLISEAMEYLLKNPACSKSTGDGSNATAPDHTGHSGFGHHDFHRSGGDCEDRWAYAVFCAVVGLVCVIILFIFTLATKLPCWDQFFEPFLVLALWIFWMIAAIVLTFPDVRPDFGHPDVRPDFGHPDVRPDVRHPDVRHPDYTGSRESWGQGKGKQGKGKQGKGKGRGHRRPRGRRGKRSGHSRSDGTLTIEIETYKGGIMERSEMKTYKNGVMTFHKIWYIQGRRGH